MQIWSICARAKRRVPRISWIAMESVRIRCFWREKQKSFELDYCCRYRALHRQIDGEIVSAVVNTNGRAGQGQCAGNRCHSSTISGSTQSTWTSSWHRSVCLQLRWICRVKTSGSAHLPLRKESQKRSDRTDGTLNAFIFEFCFTYEYMKLASFIHSMND